MALWRLCGLSACLVAPAASFEDASLVQAYVGFGQEPTNMADKQRMVTAERDLVNTAHELLRAAIRPHRKLGIDMDDPLPVNVTTEELIKAAKSVLDAFRSQVFVRTAYQGLKNMTIVWSAFAGFTVARVNSLNATGQDFNISEDAVFSELYHFWLRHGSDVAQVLAAAAASFEIVGAALPKGYLREILPGKLGGPEAVFWGTLDNLSTTIDNVVSTTFNVSRNSTSFCDHMGSFLANVSTPYLELPKVIKALNKAVPRMPSIQPMVMDVAPDVGPTLFEFMNTSYSMASNVSRLLEAVLQNVTNVSTSILVHRLGCDAAPLEAQLRSFESDCSHSGLGLVAFVAMVWLALWDR